MAKNDELRNIGVRLQNFRLKAGLTQEELAEAVGIGESTIRRYESGDSEMPSTTMFRIASALKINVYWLMPDTYEKELNTFDSKSDNEFFPIQTKLKRVNAPIRKSLTDGWNLTLDSLIAQGNTI